MEHELGGRQHHTGLTEPGLRDVRQREHDCGVRRFGGDKNPGARKKAITAIAHTLLKIA